MNVTRLAFCAILGCLLLHASPALAQKNIDLEIVTAPGVALAAPQKWLAALKDLNVGSLTIRQGRLGDQAKVEDIGTKKSPAFAVTGILTPDNKLVTPGGSFGMDQKGLLKAYLAKLATGKADEPEEKILAFGLNEEQLVSVHEALAGKVTFETKGKSVGEIARKLVKELPLTTSVDPDARAAVDAGEIVHDELRGLSYGTALAATLRPAGLVFAPIRVGKEVRLRIADSQAIEEFWPIGWPPQQKVVDTLPVMVKTLNVEINDVVLREALDSIQGRVQAPFLFDHNGLARKEIDLDKKKVSLKPGKTFYKAILDRLLGQAGLKCEVRVDEAGSPLLWISTQR